MRAEARYSDAEIQAVVQELRKCDQLPEGHVCDSDEDDSDNSDCEDEEESPLAGLSATPPQGDQQAAERQEYFGKCADIPEVVYDTEGRALDFVTVAFDHLKKYLNDFNISAMVGGFLTNHNECRNGAIAACGMDKTLGQTHATELALIHIPKGTLMVEGGHAYAYETVMRY